MEVLKTRLVLEPLSRILTFTIPRLQRSLDMGHVTQMVQDQKQEYAKYNCFSMLQSITVAAVDKSIYVLDGQHRIRAFQVLGNEGYPIQNVVLPVVVYDVRDMNEVREYYNKVNHHMPIHPFEMEQAWEEYGKVFCEKIQSHFGTYLKHTEMGTGDGEGYKRVQHKCPHISISELKDHLRARDLGGIRADVLWDKVLHINAYMKQCARKQLCGMMANRLRACEAKAEKFGCEVCYLGAWRRFEWLDIAIYIVRMGIESLWADGVDIGLSDFTEKRRRIPAVLREHVWKKHNKNMCDIGECYVCESELRFADMECGHVVAAALGGQDTVDNLMPVCKSCNRDMGIMHLEEYRNMFHRMEVV